MKMNIRNTLLASTIALVFAATGCAGNTPPQGYGIDGMPTANQSSVTRSSGNRSASNRSFGDITNSGPAYEGRQLATRPTGARHGRVNRAISHTGNSIRNTVDGAALGYAARGPGHSVRYDRFRSHPLTGGRATTNNYVGPARTIVTRNPAAARTSSATGSAITHRPTRQVRKAVAHKPAQPTRNVTKSPVRNVRHTAAKPVRNASARHNAAANNAYRHNALYQNNLVTNQPIATNSVG